MKAYVPPFTGPLADFPKDPDVPEGAEYVGTRMRGGTECAVYELVPGVFSFS